MTQRRIFELHGTGAESDVYDCLVEADAVSTVHRRTKAVVIKLLDSRGDARDLGDSPLGTTAADTVDSEAAAAADAGLADGRRRRRSAAATTHDVELVAVDPPVKDDRLRTAIVASDHGQNRTPCTRITTVTATHAMRLKSNAILVFRIVQAFQCSSGARFTKYMYLTTTYDCLTNYDNVKVTIDLRKMTNLPNISRRTQGFS